MTQESTIDETAAKMAWTINDELWETAPEARRQFWRGIVNETAQAAMMPNGTPERFSAFASIEEKIKKHGIT